MKMQKVVLLFLLGAQFVVAQKSLLFDKKLIECEDKWVAYPMAKDSTYSYGFVYIDTQAGLTFDLKGNFKIDVKGNLIPKLRDQNSSMKYRLAPNDTRVAIIPEANFTALQVTATPDWLAIYRGNENSASRLFRRGFVNNEWNECSQALVFLEKVQQINPNYSGLATEMAFSYNCLKRYPDAIKVLQGALKIAPNDAYTNKELVYAEAKAGNLDAAIIAYQNALKNCKDQTYTAENSFQILQGYFFKNDNTNFEKWLAKEHDLLFNDKRFPPIIAQIKNLIKK